MSALNNTEPELQGYNTSQWALLKKKKKKHDGNNHEKFIPLNKRWAQSVTPSKGGGSEICLQLTRHALYGG